MDGKWLALGMVGGLAALSTRKRGSQSDKLSSISDVFLTKYGDEEAARKPDWQSGDHALWWSGDYRKNRYEDAQTIIEVEGNIFRDYTNLATIYGSDPGSSDWLVREITVPKDHLPQGLLPSFSSRWIMSIGQEMMNELGPHTDIIYPRERVMRMGLELGIADGR